MAVVFDLDGTLADTFPLIVTAWNAAVKEPIGRAFAPEEVYARFGPPEWEMLHKELSGRPEEETRRAVDTFHAAYEAEHEIVEPFEGITGMLHALARAGLPMGVMTGKGSHTLAITLRKLGWEGFFRSTVSGDDVQRPKPDPEGPRKVARELSIPPERCVFVGDSPADMRAGHAAGMVTIAAGWHSVYRDELPAEHPDRWANHPSDIVALVTGEPPR